MLDFYNFFIKKKSIFFTYFDFIVISTKTNVIFFLTFDTKVV